MAFNEGLAVFASVGRVQPYCAVGEFYLRHQREAADYSSPEMEAVIRRNYGTAIADKIVGKALHDRFDDEPNVWTDTDEPVEVDAGFFIFSEELDWEKGSLKATAIDGHSDTFELFFSNQADHLGTSLTRPSYDAEMAGLKFEFGEIELLLPNAAFQASLPYELQSDVRHSRVGRPARWDWEGAMMHVIAEAQTPDGLPTGHGAQARIEKMIADWFSMQTGDAPAPSQVRQRAAKIMRMLERPERPEI